MEVQEEAERGQNEAHKLLTNEVLSNFSPHAGRDVALQGSLPADLSGRGQRAVSKNGRGKVLALWRLRRA